MLVHSLAALTLQVLATFEFPALATNKTLIESFDSKRFRKCFFTFHGNYTL